MNAVLTSDYSTFPQKFSTMSRKLTSAEIQSVFQDNPSSTMELVQTNGYGKFLTVSKKTIINMFQLPNKELIEEAKEMGL